MSTKNYTGPIETVEHAMMAHMMVKLECAACRHTSSMWRGGFTSSGSVGPQPHCRSQWQDFGVVSANNRSTQ